MAWNEPGNNDKKDPWTQSGKDNDLPPELSDVLNKIKDLFGKNKKSGGRGSNAGKDKKSSNGGFGLTTLVLAGGLLLWFILGFYMVDQTEQALVLRFGKYNNIQGAGLHWNPPLVDSVYKVNTTRIRSLSQDSTMLTKDENLVKVAISVQYAVDDIRLYLLNVRNPEKSLANALDSALRHEVGRTDMNSILTEGREVLASQVTTRLASYIKNYGLGLGIRALNVESTAAPDQVQDAFDDVIRAREDRERSINQANAYENSILPEANGQAERIRQEALAYKESLIAKAQGDAARFTSLLEEYRKAPEVTRERLYIDTMQKVLSNTSKIIIDDKKGGQNVLYLPLDQIRAEASKNKSDISNYKDAQSVSNSQSIDNLAEEVSRRLQKSNTNTNNLRGGR